MRTNLKNAHNNETVYATVRLNRAEFAELSKYMHQADATKEILFPQNTQLIKIGFGWYRIICESIYSTVAKVTFALKVLHGFAKHLTNQARDEAKITEEIRKFLNPQPVTLTLLDKLASKFRVVTGKVTNQQIPI